MKKSIVGVLCFVLLAGSISAGAAYSPSESNYNVTVKVNDADIYAGTEPGEYLRPFIMEGYNRTMVPLKPIFDKLGGTAEWDAATQSVTCNTGRDNVYYKFINESSDLEVWGSDPEAYAPERVIGFDAPAVIVDGHIYIPIRCYCEAVGYSIDWNAANAVVSITVSDEKSLLTYEEAKAKAEQYVAETDPEGAADISLGGDTELVSHNGKQAYKFKLYLKSLVANGGSGSMGESIYVYADNGEIDHVVETN